MQGRGEFKSLQSAKAGGSNKYEYRRVALIDLTPDFSTCGWCNAEEDSMKAVSVWEIQGFDGSIRKALNIWSQQDHISFLHILEQHVMFELVLLTCLHWSSDPERICCGACQTSVSQSNHEDWLDHIFLSQH